MIMMDETWAEIGALKDIPREGGRVVRRSIGCIAVFRTVDDEVYAIDDRCPHKNGPLSQGIVHGNKVTCPLHNWVFSLETGQAQGADEGQVKTYRLRVEEGRIFVDVTAFAQSDVA